MELISEIELILHHKAFIRRSFLVSLIKSAFIIVSTRAARVFAAIVNVASCAFVEVEPAVDVSPARLAAFGFAIVLARYRGDRAPGINYKGLLLFL